MGARRLARPARGVTMLKSTRRFMPAAVLALTLTIPNLTQAQSPAGIAPKLLAEKSPALVTVKFVLKIKFGGHDQERETEITGIMMDPKGLILCSSQQVGGISPAMKRMMNMG